MCGQLLGCSLVHLTRSPTHRLLGESHSERLIVVGTHYKLATCSASYNFIRLIHLIHSIDSFNWFANLIHLSDTPNWFEWFIWFIQLTHPTDPRSTYSILHNSSLQLCGWMIRLCALRAPEVRRLPLTFAVSRMLHGNTQRFASWMLYPIHQYDLSDSFIQFLYSIRLFDYPICRFICSICLFRSFAAKLYA